MEQQQLARLITWRSQVQVLPVAITCLTILNFSHLRKGKSMPVQQQKMASFARQLGNQVAAANAEHADKPVDTGNRRPPAGIKNGVAKLSSMYLKEYEDDKSGLKGKVFFRASAVIVSPEEFDGQKCAGLVTSVVIPMCDVPAKGMRKAKSFSDNYFEFQNIFKLLGVAPCPETPQTDPTGQRTEAYFVAAMNMLTDPNRVKTNPVYVSFSTRGWTPGPTPAQPKPDEMVLEYWHGLATWNGKVDPAGAVQHTQSLQPDAGTPAPPPAPVPTAVPSHNGPPTSAADGLPTDVESQDDQGDQDPADVVTALVEVAMNDPEGATEDGASASAQLEEMAWSMGWSKDQTANAADWAAVGDMALNAPGNSASADPESPSTGQDPTVGSRWKFTKRTKDGEKLKNGKGEEFPPQDVEVVSVDTTNGTCTVKSAKDGKDIVDIRTKKPVDVKFEWLE